MKNKFLEEYPREYLESFTPINIELMFAAFCNGYSKAFKETVALKVKPEPEPVPVIDWEDVLLITRSTSVDSAIRNFTTNLTEDNAACVTRAIIEELYSKIIPRVVKEKEACKN